MQGGGFSTSSSETTLSEAVLILRKRKWILILTSLLGLAFGLFRVLSQPRLYEAYARVQVRTGASDEYKVSGVTSPGLNGDIQNRMQTEIAILQSDTLLLAVARELNLANNPDFTGAKDRAAQFSLDDARVRQGVVQELQAGLHVVLVPKTEIMLVSYSSLNAKLSAEIVNKVVADYIQRSYEVRYASTQRVSQWLSSQLEDLKLQVATSQEQVMDLQKKLGVLGLDSKDSSVNASLEDLARAAGTSRIARIVAESRYRMLSNGDVGTVDGTIETTPGTAPTEFYALRSQIAIAKANYAQLMTTYGPNHPLAKTQASELAELERQLDSEQKRLVAQAKQNYLAAKANQDQTSAALDQQKGDAYKLRDDLVDYTVKSRELESNRALYEGLVNRLRTAGVQAGLEAVEIDVVDQAQVPASPIPKPYSTVLISATLFGLIVGIAIAFLLESLDTGLRGIAEIESAIELPSLAIIPKARRTSADQLAALTVAQRNVSVLASPKSHFSEAFRSLRTSLLLSAAGHPPKVVVFTSATPSEGKTSTACNLACVLAQREARVLLIDADLRRPNIHHRFGLSGKVGLSTLLSGVSTLEDTVQRVAEAPNLDVLASGPVPPFPTEMLGSAAMSALLDRVKHLYSHIVIDSPPILSVTDGVVLARQSDAVVLVVRHGKSSKHVVRRARDLLIRSGAPITGLVLNAVDMNSPEYYGYYGYSGYSYSSVDSDSWDSQIRATTKAEGRDGQ